MHPKRFSAALTRYYAWYTVGFILFLITLAILEQEGFPRVWLGYLFIFATIVLLSLIHI